MKKKFNEKDGWWSVHLTLKSGTFPLNREKILAYLTGNMSYLYEVGEYKQHKAVVFVVLRKLPITTKTATCKK